MRLPKFVQTSSFRLTLLYAAIFGGSVLILFGVMLWSGTGFIAGQIDRTVLDELTEIQNDAVDGGAGSVQRVVTGMSNRASPGVYYLLEDAAGRVLAGNMPPVERREGIQSWRLPRSIKPLEPVHHGIRGRGIRLIDGNYLFVGIDDFELDEMQEMITRSFLWVLGATILLALGGGALMSVGLLRRVEAISVATRDIVAGDLGRRIPIKGSDDEFDHLGHSLNAMLDRIEELMNGLRQVSNDIAHDLRTPLTRLRQKLELGVRKEPTAEVFQGLLEASLREVDGILDTFSGILRIAQIEAHTKSAVFSDIDLSELLNRMIDAYQTVTEERGQYLIGNIKPGLLIRGDRELLPQLFSNVIENSMGHSQADAIINITANSYATHIEVVIGDNGPGIPAEQRDRVFQRFFRLESSRTTPGTGLGLSLVQAVAKLHGAQIMLEDNHPGLRVRLIFLS